MAERRGHRVGKNPNPEGTKKRVFSSTELLPRIERVRQHADYLPTALRDIIHQPWPAYTLSDQQTDKANKALFSVTLLPPESPLLTDSYNLLTGIITDEDASLVERIAAVGLASFIMHQTTLETEDKYRFQGHTMKGSRAKKKGKIDIAYKLTMTLDTEHRPTEASSKAYQKLKADVAEFQPPATVVSDRETVHTNLLEMNAVVGSLDSFVWEVINSGCDPVTRSRLITMIDHLLEARMREPYAIHLLLDGLLSNLHIQLQYKIWERDLISTNSATDVPQPSKDQLRAHLLTDTALQKEMWQASFDSNEAVIIKITEDDGEQREEREHVLSRDYLTFNEFMKKDIATFESFLQTIPFDSLRRPQKEQLFGKIVGFLAIFHYINDNQTEYLAKLRKSVTELAEQQRLVKDIAYALDILADKKPGVIHISPQAGLQVDRDPTYKSVSPDDLVAYVSTGPQAEQKQEKPVTAITEQEQPDAAKKPETIVRTVSRGEPLSVAHWGEIVPPAGLVTEILTHLDERFSQIPSTDIAWEDHLKRYTIPQEQLYSEAVVFPSLIAEDHPLHALADVGVVAIQRQTTNDVTSYAVILDTQRAGLLMEGETRTVLTGRLVNNRLQFAGRETQRPTALTQALTEAALLTYQEKPASSTGKLRKRYQATEAAITDWNTFARRESNPPLEIHAPYHYVDTAVVVPAGREVFLFRLKR